MGKFLVILGRNIRDRICYTPAQFVITLFGLCVCAITCMVMLQIVMENLFEFNSTGDLVKKGVGDGEAIVYTAVTAILIVLMLVNLIALFRHLTSSRRKKQIIYKMYGCTRSQLFFLSFSEEFFYLLLGGAASGLYAPLYIWQRQMHRVMFPQACWSGMILYSLSVLIVALISSFSAAGVRLNRREG